MQYHILILSNVWKIPNDALLFCQGFHWWTCATQMELLPCNVRCDVHVPRVWLQLMYMHFTLVYLVVGLHPKKDRHPNSIVHMCTQVNHRSYCWLNSRPYMCDYIIWIQCVYANGHVFFWDFDSKIYSFWPAGCLYIWILYIMCCWSYLGCRSLCCFASRL